MWKKGHTKTFDKTTGTNQEVNVKQKLQNDTF